MKKSSLSLAAGVLFASAGLLFNPVFLGWFFAPDGKLEGLSFISVALAMDAFLLFFGVLLIRSRQNTPWRMIAVSFAACILIFCGFIAWDFHIAYKSLYAADRQEILTGVHDHDPELGWKPRAGAAARHVSAGIFDVLYEMDENGFKKTPYHENAERSIYFFGDSFTFGSGVSNESTFANILDSQYLDGRVNVYNAGVMGYGIMQMYLRYLTVEDRIRPGDVVAVTPITPDLNRGFETYFLAEGLLFGGMGDFRSRKYPRFKNGGVEFVEFGSWYAAFEVLSSFAPYTGFIFEGIKNKMGLSALQQSREILTLMKRRVEARGARFVLAFLPMSHEMASSRYEIDLEDFDHQSLLPYLARGWNEAVKLEIPEDNHPNAAGHAALAGALAEVLAQPGLLGREYFKKAAPQT